MRTTRVAIALVVMFVLTMSAGVVTGRMTSRPPQPAEPLTQPAGVAGGSPLAAELGLSAEQAARMRPIWEAARDTARACAAEADRVQREHEEQLVAMLSDEQKAKYQGLTEANHRRIAELDARRRGAFREAVDKTRAVLREDQWRAYEQIIRNQVGALPSPADEPERGQ